MKTKLFASVIAVGTALGTAQAQDINIINTPSFTRETDRALSAACPTPILKKDDEQASAECVRGTLEQASRLSNNMSAYVDEHGPISPFKAGILKGDLLRCSAKKATSTAAATNLSFERYLQVTVGAARECIQSFDRVARELGVNLEQDSRNLIVDQLNCFVSPDQCIRPRMFDKI